jgi:hypothetical protein
VAGWAVTVRQMTRYGLRRIRTRAAA